MKTSVTRAAMPRLIAEPKAAFAGIGRNCGNLRSSFLFQPEVGEKSDQDPEKKEMHFTCAKTTYHVVRFLAFW
jgi:hypothetical protein